MASSQTRSRDERRRLRPLAALVCAASAFVLAGCGAVETYRSLAGVNKNDPDPQTSVFTGNMAEAEAGPYPNLATVPAPPTRATTAAERQKLAEALVAERSATAAAGEGLPASPTASARPVRQAGTKSPKLGADKSGTAAPASPAMAVAGPAGSAPMDAGGRAGSSETRLASNATPAAGGASGPRRSDEPPPPRPRDSSMQMPEIRTTPEPEAARPAPPKPALAAVTPPSVFAAPAPAAASVTPAPPPAVPVLAPVPSPPVLATATPSRAAGPARTVATVELTGARLNPTGQAEIDRIASLYKEKPGTVRVVARTPPPTSGAEGLAGYHAALDDAQAVADRLKTAGIPANKIQTEAMPSAAATPGRIDIQFAP